MNIYNFAVWLLQTHYVLLWTCRIQFWIFPFIQAPEELEWDRDEHVEPTKLQPKNTEDGAKTDGIELEPVTLGKKQQNFEGSEISELTMCLLPPLLTCEYIEYLDCIFAMCHAIRQIESEVTQITYLVFCVVSIGSFAFNLLSIGSFNATFSKITTWIKSAEIH